MNTWQQTCYRAMVEMMRRLATSMVGNCFVLALTLNRVERAAGAVFPQPAPPSAGSSLSSGFTPNPIPNAMPNPNQSATESAPDAVPGEYLVGFRPDSDDGQRRRAATLLKSKVRWITGPETLPRPWALQSVPASRSAGSPVAENSARSPLALVRLESQIPHLAAVNELRRQPGVAFVEPNYRIHLRQSSSASETLPSAAPSARHASVPLANSSGSTMPDDFQFPNQWALHNTGQESGREGADIAVLEAWKVTRGSRGIQVAVIDSGIDLFHPDLEANFWINSKEIPGNGLDDDGNGYIDDSRGYDFVSDDSDPMDDLGHGTHVAGIIGADGGNRAGIAGVCWEAALMALKAFDEHGDGDLVSAIAAIDYARENGARIINASWGLPERSRALREAIEQAQASGILIVAAAGNNKSDQLIYPARYTGVLAVASTTRNEERSLFSNFGPRVDIAAPGDQILSTLPNNRFDFQSGTSMAAPHVAGVAALVLARHPEFTANEVRSVLINTTDPLWADRFIGRGSLNAGRALAVEKPLPVVSLVLPERIQGVVDVAGAADTEEVTGYSLAYGAGDNPETWTRFHEVAGRSAGGYLIRGWETAAIADGAYWIRLDVTNRHGKVASEIVACTVENAAISFPQYHDILRSGEPMEIRGTVHGVGRRFRIEYAAGAFAPHAWQTNGMALASNGQQSVVDGVLALWDTRNLRDDQYYTLRLTVEDPRGGIQERWVRMLYLDGRLRQGWPRAIPITGDFPEDDWRELEVADLDGDGQREIIFLDPGNEDGKPSTLNVLRADGTLAWRRDIDSGAPYSDRPAVGDVDGDGRQEIFVDAGAGEKLYAFKYDGSPLEGNWPVKLEASALAKVLADLDGDGFLEIIGLSQNTVEWNGSRYHLLTVHDRKGALLRRWQLYYCEPKTTAPRQFPAVGNFDADKGLEIVVAVPCEGLSLYDFQDGGKRVWNTLRDATIVGSPAIGDLDGDHLNEIVVAAYSEKNMNRGGVYIYDHQGRVWTGWPVLIEESFVATPALADFDGDGYLEICLPSWDSDKLHLLHLTGFEAQGWPIGPIEETKIRSSFVVADLDANGYLDVLLPSPGFAGLVAALQDLNRVGGMRAWNFFGEPLDLNPASVLATLPMEASVGSVWSKAAPAVITDLDGDGFLDILGTSIQDRTYRPPGEKSERKQRSSIYAWQLPVPISETSAPWPSFQRGTQHTGYYLPPQQPPQGPVVRDIPNQLVPTGVMFRVLRLDDFVEDADTIEEEIVWTASGNNELSVTIQSDRTVTVRAPTADWAGSETVRFTARDPAGLTASDTATFTSRLGYIPPLANNDEAVTLEDQPMTIDLLANDLHPRGLPLSISSTGRPSAGILEAAGAGKFVWHFPENFNGVSRFSYTITDPEGGFNEAQAIVRVQPVADPPVVNPDRVILVEDQEAFLNPLDNDEDVDGGRLRLVEAKQPQNGSTRVGADGFIQYIPRPDFHGVDRFDYVAVNDSGLSSTGEVAVLVKPVNDVPKIEDQKLKVRRNSQVNVNYTAVDPDSTELKYKITEEPKHGELWSYPNFGVYYPKAGFVGTDQLRIEASDGIGQSAPALVTIEVLEENNPPESTAQSLATKPRQWLNITLEADDADDDPMTYEIVTPPSHGELEGEPPEVRYRAHDQFLGQDQFEFRARDAAGPGPKATVDIRVTDQNTAPIAKDSGADVPLNKSAKLKPDASDAEGDALIYEVLAAPVHGLLGGEPPAWTYTPDKDYEGFDRLVYRVSDGVAWSGSASIALNVKFPNETPLAKDQEFILYAGEVLEFELPATDADGDPLRSAILKGPRRGLLSGRGTQFRYAPKPGSTGQDSFTYQVWDGRIYSSVGRVTIVISSEPAPLRLKFESISLQPDAAVRLMIACDPGRQLEVQASSDFQAWETIHNAVAQSATEIVIDAMRVGAPRHRYYRALQHATRN